jgi:hypothetical protein
LPRLPKLKIAHTSSSTTHRVGLAAFAGEVKDVRWPSIALVRCAHADGFSAL